MKQTLTAVGILAFAAALPARGNCTEAGAALRIEHTTAPCVVSGRHARIEARIEPVGEARTARVVFHAAHSTSWYAVEMNAGEGGVWSGPLPRAKEEALRIEYFIVASGPAARGRFPQTGVLVTDVTPLCGDEGLPTAPQSPNAVGFLGAADRRVPGFDMSDVPGAIEGMVEETPDRGARRPFALAVAPIERVRLTTVSPLSKGKRLREDGQSVTFPSDDDGTPVTLAKAGRKLEGWLDTADDGVVVLSVKGAGRVRVRQQDIVGIEVYKKGSPALAAVGGLAGVGAGFFGTLLVCATGDVCHDVGVGALWIGTALGGVIGAAAGGVGEWQPAPFLREHRVSLALQPTRRGAAMGVRLSF